MITKKINIIKKLTEVINPHLLSEKSIQILDVFSVSELCGISAESFDRCDCLIDLISNSIEISRYYEDHNNLARYGLLTSKHSLTKEILDVLIEKLKIRAILVLERRFALEEAKQYRIRAEKTVQEMCLV